MSSRTDEEVVNQEGLGAAKRMGNWVPEGPGENQDQELGEMARREAAARRGHGRWAGVGDVWVVATLGVLEMPS